jgi:hypothetical protein
MVSEHLHSCRNCGSGRLELILDLGSTPPANRFLRLEQLNDPEPTVPLRLVLCEQCGLVQIDETIPPAVLFSDYIYVSGTSDTVVQHARTLAQRLVERYAIRPGDLVCEAASNDGTVLRAFQWFGVRTLGVEPASNIARLANETCVETVNAFFGRATALDVRTNHGFAKLLLARHVLAHVADLHDFLFGVRVMLADDGVAVVEVPYLLPFYQNLEYDTIYHEHLCYFSLRVLVQLAEQHDLEVIEVEEAPLHGGSIVVTMQPVGGPHYVRASVDRYLAYEQEVGLHTMPRWREFARRVEQNRQAVRREVEFLIAHGQRVVGYGAAAKGMTLLAACGLGREHLPYIVDRSPRKQGLFTPGHHIPVLPCDRLLLEQPEVVLLLAWNFATEVLQQQAAYRRRGGRFLLPVPMPHYAEIDQPLALLRAA